MKKLIVLSMIMLGAVLSASAIDVVRKDTNTTGIATNTAAWVSGAVPTASDVAVWNSTIASATATNSLGVSSSWQGIRVGSASSRAVTLNAAGTETLTLGSSGIDMTSAKNDFTIRTKVALGASQTWAVTNARTLNVSGEISGASDKVLTKNDLGTLTLGGSNTYSGGTVLNAGTLNITNNDALGSGTLTINGGTLNNSANAYTTNVNATVINNDFTVSMTGNRGLNLGGNGISLGTNAGSSRMITVVTNATGNGLMQFRGAIVNGTTANQLIKSGDGAIGLFGTNTYSGGTVLNGGDLFVNNSGSVGSGILTINGGSINANSATATGQVTLAHAGTVINSDFTVNRVTGGGVKVVDFGTGGISLGSNGTSRTITQGGSSAIYLNGNISDGTGGSKQLILKNGSSGFAGTMYLNGTNSYSGGTEIDTLTVTTSNQYALGSGGLTIQNNSITNVSKLKLDSSLTIGGLLSSGASSSTGFTGIDLGAATNTLTLNQSGSSEYGHGIMGSGKLVKSGLGTLTFSGSNSYSGATTVSGGKLVVNSIYNNSKITVQNGGTLGGTGSLKAVTLDAGAILSVGNSAGTMLFDGAVILSAGSTNIMEILTSGFDLLRDSAGTNKLTLAGVNIFDFSGNTVTNGATFAVFQNWGSITNSGATFTGINMGAGQSVAVNITGGIGVLTVIPEPATIGMLGLGAIITMLLRRMRG